MAKKEAFLH